MWTKRALRSWRTCWTTFFHLYDEDTDGLIERVEFLDAEEKRFGRLNFGPPQRKVAFTWFKDAGAEGTPIDGMFLTHDKFVVAYAKAAATESGILESDAGALADWLTENRLHRLAEVLHHPAPGGGEARGAAAPSAAPHAPRSYPHTCSLRALAEELHEARSAGRAVLVLASGLDEVETFMAYQHNSVVDCKQLINELFVSKSKTKPEVQEELRGKLVGAMNSIGFARPLHIRMSNSAFDWVNTCCEHFPAEVFSGSLWTIQHAFELGFFDESQKFNLEVEDEKRWKEFHVIITSTFDLEKANEFLFDKIPFYDELAIIIVDPASVKK